MFRRLAAIAVLAIAVPVMAYGWSLNTWVKSSGGTITVNGVSQSVTNGSVFKTYTGSLSNTSASQNPTVSFTVPAGYTANYSYTNNTGTLNTVANAIAGTVFSQVFSNANVNSGSGLAELYVTFETTFQSASVTGTTDSNITMYPASMNVAVGSAVGTPGPTFTFTTKPGYVINTITASDPAIIIPAIPANATTLKVVLPYKYVFTSAGLQFSATSTGSATVSIPNAGAPQTFTSVPATVTLNGGVIGNQTVAFKNWSCVSWPTGATQPFAKTSTNPVTFTPAAGVNGSYTFIYRISNTQAAETFVTIAPATTVSNLVEGRNCQACHTQNGIGTGNIYAQYSSGNTHKNSSHSLCSACHYGTGNGGHPGTVNYASVNNSTFLVNVAGINAGGPEYPASINAPGPGVVFCSYCHNAASPYGVPAHVSIPLNPGVTCAACHTDPNGQNTGTGDAHSVQPLPGCVTCHAVGQKQVNATLVNDNNGVRAITGANGEFEMSSRTNAMGYRSHHIYNGAGVDPQDAQCIACHLEGSASGRTVSVNSKYHMADGMVHLRDGNTTLGQSQSVNGGFAWDPANPNHTLMDQFCMSCHNSAGAVTAYANMSTALYGMTPIAGAQPLSAKNPFGDQLTNAYDQKVRPAVVAVYDQFNPANPSHHAVRGQKYSGRTRNAADPNGRVVTNPAAFTQYSGVGSADIHPNAAGVLTVYQVFGTYSTNGSGASHAATATASGFGPQFAGSRTTLYDAGFFVAAYTTLDGATLGDDSTLHCGDCHSVGQYTSNWSALQSGTPAKAVVWANSSSATGTDFTVENTTVTIGAHGSQNEYMLRTSNGTDSLQKQSSIGKATAAKPYSVNGTYVCFLCHKQDLYGDNPRLTTTTVLGTGAAAESTSEDEHGGNLYVGGCNAGSNSGYGKKGTARYGVLVNGTATPSIGNVFAMSCAHCHNSGQQNFGGIHGATGTYTAYSTNGMDVVGTTKAPGDNGNPGGGYLLNVTQKKSYRFMGGESNRYNGGATANKWEAQQVNAFHREGCYNLSDTTDATHLWNTTQPMTAAAGSIPAIQNNGNGDSAWGVTDYTSTLTGRYGQNNATSGWGSCNHHQGSTTTGPTGPTRVIQRPLVY